jgi:hypothetical protein
VALAGQKLTWVVRLPSIDPPLGAGDPCMARPISWPARLFRQVFPPRRIRDCCYYHSMDMRAVARAVVRIHRIIRQVEGPLSQPEADTRSATGAELADDLRAALLRTAGLTEEEGHVASLMLAEDCGIQLWLPEGERRWTYQNGRHRARALMDAGARRIVVSREDDRDYAG